MDVLLTAVASAVVLVLPGLALLVWLPGKKARDGWDFLADAVGLSIAVHTAVALLFYLVGIAPGGWGLAVGLALAIIALVAAGLTGRLTLLGRGDWAGWLAGVGVIAGAVALRIYQARDLAFPNWVDSVHHTLIVGAFLKTGGIPAALQLSSPAPFHYHYTFHLLAAEVAGLAKIGADQAVLWFGHALFAVLPLAIYRLARALGLDRAGGLIAALLPAFVLHMPGYYVSWGRYTLLTGMILLPLVMSAVLEALDLRFKTHPKAEVWADLAKLALLCLGMCLTHYLALLLFLFFLAVLGAERVILAVIARDWGRLPWAAAGACLAGGTAALPWLVPMIVFNAAEATLTAPSASFGGQDFKGFVDMLRPEQSLAVMGIAGVCLILALFKGNVRVIAIWGALVALFAMPFAPRLGPFRSDHYTIVLFLPAALLVGWGLSRGAVGLRDLVARRAKNSAVENRAAWISIGVLALAVGLLVGWGVFKTRNIINRATIIADAADRRALEWAAVNTPGEARFYINSTRWLGEIYRGVDGGYWLLPLTGRASLLPPVVYVWQADTERKQVNAWAVQSAEIKSCTPEFWQLVREADLTHVYVREGKGSLQPSGLVDCARLERLYDQDGIGIYRIKLP
jgi:hypothetical protein